MAEGGEELKVLSPAPSGPKPAPASMELETEGMWELWAGEPGLEGSGTSPSTISCSRTEWLKGREV